MIGLVLRTITGFLLRLFSYWNDLDPPCDVFLKWKEDISHNFPGEGKAPFRVCKNINYRCLYA